MAPIDGKVMRVIDGDTIEVAIKVRTRVSAPERNTPEGADATALMRKLYPHGRRINLHMVAADPYRRMIAVLTEPG